MTKTKNVHPGDMELADYLSSPRKAIERDRIREHLASCPECLEKSFIAYDSVKEFRKAERSGKRKDGFMKRLNIYLILAVIAFLLSFMAPRHFLQFLAAAIILGAKWVVDSKTTKMLIMVQEALKKDGGKEASRVLDRLGCHK